MSQIPFWVLGEVSDPVLIIFVPLTRNTGLVHRCYGYAKKKKLLITLVFSVGPLHSMNSCSSELLLIVLLEVQGFTCVQINFHVVEFDLFFHPVKIFFIFF